MRTGDYESAVEYIKCPKCHSWEIGSRGDNGYRCNMCKLVFQIVVAGMLRRTEDDLKKEEYPINRPRYFRPMNNEDMLRLENIDRLNCGLYDALRTIDKFEERISNLEVRYLEVQND